MEEETQSKENTQKEIKLLTFDPLLMQEEIIKLRIKVTTLEEELITLRRETLKRCLQSLLLELFGGCYNSKEMKK